MKMSCWDLGCLKYAARRGPDDRTFRERPNTPRCLRTLTVFVHVEELCTRKPLSTSRALRGLHNDIGHPGGDRTTSLVRERFWWPGMAHDVENWCKQCQRCLRRKAAGNTAPLVNIITSQPLELVCMDYLSVETSSGGYQHMLVITDHFTRYARAILTRNQTAKTTAEALFNSFIVHYGFPKQLHYDQGANFESSRSFVTWPELKSPGHPSTIQ